MNLKHETKEVLLCASLFGIACIIVLSMTASMSGCTTTGTDSLISDSTVKAMTEAVAKLDKDQVKKLETSIKEKLKSEEKTSEKNETENKSSTELIGSPDEPTGITTNNNTETTEQPATVDKSNYNIDAFPLEKLKINVAVDSPQLIRHYTNGWTTENPWALIKDLPVTVTIKKFDASGIDLKGVPQGKYENEKWERTSCFWAFDENGNELCYEDNAYTTYPEPGRFYGKCKYILVVSTADFGSTFQITGRSRVTEVK